MGEQEEVARIGGDVAEQSGNLQPCGCNGDDETTPDHSSPSTLTLRCD